MYKDSKTQEATASCVFESVIVDKPVDMLITSPRSSHESEKIDSFSLDCDPYPRRSMEEQPGE